MQGEPTRHAGIFREHWFDGMKVTIRSQKLAGARKNAVRVWCVDMMKKAVNQNKIIRTGRNGFGRCNVCYQKITTIATSR
jgi:hypothetical protein